MKKSILFLIKVYQTLFSPLKRKTCVFYPSCSEFAKQSIKKHGVVKGGYKSLGRILKCHPWQKNRVDLP